jgi:hypothetical protein
VGKCDFGTRLTCIEKEIVGARNTYIVQVLRALALSIPRPSFRE